MSRRALTLSAVAIAAIVAVVIARTRHDGASIRPPELDRDDESAKAPVVAPRESSPRPSVSPSMVTPESEMPETPASLRGTEPDGSLEVDGSGRFVPTRASLRFFDYFLSTLGETTESEVRALVDAAIAARLAAPARGEALAFFDRYVAYRAEIVRSTSHLGSAREVLDMAIAVRRRTFGPELAEKLFGDDERIDAAALEAQAIAADRALPEEGRAARLAAVEARTPRAELEARSSSRVALDFAREDQEARARGGTEEQLAELRRARYGVETEQRLAARDAQRALWNQRVEAYRASRDRILGSTASGPARDRALEALRAQGFAGPELVRIRALDVTDGID